MIIFRSDKTLDSVRKPTEQTERLRKAYSDFTLCWLHDIVPQIAPLQLSLRSNQFNLWNSASFNIEKWSKFRWTFSISILNWTARGLWELAANSKYCKPTIKDTIATLLALLCRGSDWCFNGGIKFAFELHFLLGSVSRKVSVVWWGVLCYRHRFQFDADDIPRIFEGCKSVFWHWRNKGSWNNSPKERLMWICRSIPISIAYASPFAKQTCDIHSPAYSLPP